MTEAEFKAVLQHLFEVMFKALVRQNAPSFLSLGPDLADRDEPPNCAYRGDFGCKCAVGWLIDDAYYDPLIEGRAASYQSVIGAVQLSQGLPPLGSNQNYRLGDFLDDAQRLLHDTPAERGDFRAAVRLGAADLAKRFDLTMPPLNPQGIHQ